MNRRALLAGIGTTGAAVAGCLRPDEASEPDPADDPDPTNESDPGEGSADGSDLADEDTPEWDPDEWQPSWELETELGWLSDIEIIGKTAYVTTSESGSERVAAVDPATGERLWSVDDRGGIWETSDGITLLDADGDRYVARAIDPSSGEIRSSTELAYAQTIDEAPPKVEAVTDDAIYIVERMPEPVHDASDTESNSDSQSESGSFEGAFTAYDSASGDELFRLEFDSDVHEVTVGPERVILDLDGRLVGYTHDGDRQFAHEDIEALRTVPLSDGTFVVLGPFRYDTDERATLAHLGKDGRLRWSKELPVQGITVDGGRIYAGGHETLAIELDDGEIIWRNETYGREPLLGPGGERVYMRTGDRADAVAAYDTADGTELWLANPPVTNAWPVAATDDLVAVGTLDTVYAVSADDGGAEYVFDRYHTGMADRLSGTLVAANRDDGGKDVYGLPIDE